MSEMTAPVTGKKLLFVTGTRADFGKLQPNKLGLRSAFSSPACT